MLKLVSSVVGAWLLTVGCSSDPEGSENAGGTAGHAGSAQGGSHSAGAGQGGGGAAHAGSGAGGSAQGGTGPAGSGGRGGLGGAASGDGGSDSMAGAGGTMAGAGGGDSSRGIIAECLDAPLMGSRTEAIRLEGNGVSVALVRRIDLDSVGTSGTTVWLTQRLGLVRGDVSGCVSDAAKLTYTVSHHNSNDFATAASGGTTWVLEQKDAEYWRGVHQISAKQGNQVLWGPIALTIASCTQLDTDTDCTAKYQ
jgi:hypothetical protein